MRTTALVVTLVALFALHGVGPRPVAALGITTHNAIARDMIRNSLGPNMDRELYNIMNEFPGAVECGSIWSDVHYLIQTFPNASDAAEHMHWPPHYTAALTYIQNNFSQPYNDEARKLIAFYMGVISHSVADQWWHGLGVPCYAALEEAEDRGEGQMGGLEFNLDLYIKSTLAQGPTPRDDWYLPADHCEAILHSEGWTDFTAELNTDAITLSYIGAWLENLIGPAMYLPLKFSMPWTTANFEYHPCGGYWDCVDRSVAEIQEEFAKLKGMQFPVIRAAGIPAAFLFSPMPDRAIRQAIDQHHRDHYLKLSPNGRNPNLVNMVHKRHSHRFVSGEAAQELLNQGIVTVRREKVAGGYRLHLPEVQRPAQLFRFVHTMMNDLH